MIMIVQDTRNEGGKLQRDEKQSTPLPLVELLVFGKLATKMLVIMSRQVVPATRSSKAPIAPSACPIDFDLWPDKDATKSSSLLSTA